MQLLAPTEIAKRLSISRSAAYRLVKRLEHIYVESSLRVRETVLQEYLERRTVRPVARPAKGSTTSHKRPTRKDGTAKVRPTQPGTTPKKGRRG